jgi:type IV secretory pathway component VirB8
VKRRGRMNTTKRTARVVGALFITATAAAIVSGAFLLPILEAPDYLAKVSANENQVMMGALVMTPKNWTGAIVNVQ